VYGVTVCFTAVPANTLAPPFTTSTRLMTCLLRDTWMLKVNPQPAPQVNPAVPEPLPFRVRMLKVSVVVVEPHPALLPVRVSVDCPTLFSLPTYNKDETPQPVLPAMATCHGPAS